MKSKKLWLGMLVLVSVLVFGMTVLGCDDGSSGGADPALNGIWISGSSECTYNNGNWEDRVNNTPYAKGTYTTNNGEMTTKTTHIWGIGVHFNQLNLDAKWYTKAELQSLNIPNFESFFPEDGYTRTYSINGNTLTFTDRNGNAAGTWTRKE